jgi:hypothetical protein
MIVTRSENGIDISGFTRGLTSAVITGFKLDASAWTARDAVATGVDADGTRGVVDLRGRGALEPGVFARPDNPSRWTLPITALRVTLPISPAI